MKKKFPTYPVKNKEIQAVMETSNSKITKKTMFLEHKFHEDYRTPMYSCISHQGFIEFIETLREDDEDMITLAVFLTIASQITTKDSYNVAEITLESIAVYLKTYRKRIQKSVEYLIDKGFIEKKGNAKYMINPNISWHGSFVDWAEALISTKKQKIIVTEPEKPFFVEEIPVEYIIKENS